jgi:apolipoprotein N-acyltransferase
MWKRNLNFIFLLFFFLFLSFVYIGLYSFVYISFIPLFFYLYNIKSKKEFNWLFFTFLIFIYSLLFFKNLQGYGFKFFILIFFISLLFYFLLIYFSIVFNNSFYRILFFIFFYSTLYFIFGLTEYGNFWINFSSFLFFYPYFLKFFGSYFYNILILFFNFAFFYIILLIFNKKERDKFLLNKIKLILIIFSFFLISFLLFLPSNIISNYNIDNCDSYLNVLAIQPNFNLSWDDRCKMENYTFNDILNYTIGVLNNLTKENKNVDLVIWPEYTITNPFEFDFKKQELLRNFVENRNINLILGSIKLVNLSSEYSKRYNSLYIFLNNGSIENYYANEPVMVFDKEVKKYSGINKKIIINNVSIGLILCYEENFPYIFRNQILYNNASMFFIIGNQYYINNYEGLKITSLNANLRAVEFDRNILRLETGGLSKVINFNGKTIYSIPIKKRGYVYWKMCTVSNKTYYTKYGNYINLFIFIFSVIIIIFLIFRKNNL